MPFTTKRLRSSELTYQHDILPGTTLDEHLKSGYTIDRMTGRLCTTLMGEVMPSSTPEPWPRITLFPTYSRCIIGPSRSYTAAF